MVVACIKKEILLYIPSSFLLLTQDIFIIISFWKGQLMKQIFWHGRDSIG